ncbi:MAG: alpha-galactosidase, partial [Clostridiaceae bacterium]|nr:alpha-galactosidase [Clostridiaceae bacterium]
IEYHKQICNELKDGLPFWPMGLASMSDEYLSVGIECKNKLYLAVWRTTGDSASVKIPIKQAEGKIANVTMTYPSKMQVPFNWDNETSTLEVKLAPKTARIFEISI